MVAVIIMMINKTHTKLIRMLLTNIELDNLNISKVSNLMFERSNLELSNDNDSVNTILDDYLADIDQTYFTEDLENEEAIVNKANILRKR